MDKLIIAACDEILAEIKRDIESLEQRAKDLDTFYNVKVAHWHLKWTHDAGYWRGLRYNDAAYWDDGHYTQAGPNHNYCPLSTEARRSTLIMHLGSVWPKLHVKAIKQLAKQQRKLGALHMQYLKQQKPMKSFVKNHEPGYAYWIWLVCLLLLLIGCIYGTWVMIHAPI